MKMLLVGVDAQMHSVAGAAHTTFPALFCDADGGDLTVCADSPAIAPDNGCGQIGAFGQGCGPCGVVPTQAHSWSAVKGLFK